MQKASALTNDHEKYATTLVESNFQFLYTFIQTSPTIHITVTSDQICRPQDSSMVVKITFKFPTSAGYVGQEWPVKSPNLLDVFMCLRPSVTIIAVPRTAIYVKFENCWLLSFCQCNKHGLTIVSGVTGCIIEHWSYYG